MFFFFISFFFLDFHNKLCYNFFYYLQEYVLRVDPVTNLGLSAESVFSYHIGEIMRTKDAELPELLPIGYLVGETMQIGICLKGMEDIF